MVRETLGEDAVIVATREERGGRGVNVTAAIDPDSYSAAPSDARFDPAFEVSRSGRAASEDNWLQYDDEQDEFAAAEELTDVMLRHGVPEDVMDNIISCATVVGLDSAHISLVAALEHLFHFRPLPQKPHKKAIMMVGAPGSGKTLAVAKMAARSVMNDLSVGVITCDTVRAGGVEQLGAFTNLLKTDLRQANSPQNLAYIIDELSDRDQIIIDTAGANPFNTEDIKTLAKLINAADVEPYLTVQAGIDSEESGEMARCFAALGVHTIIPTRIDLTRRLGGLLAAAHHGSMSFADASNTPKVANGLFSLNPQNLARLLMPSVQNTRTSAVDSAHNTPLRKTGSH